MNGELVFAFFSGCATMLIAGLLTRWFACPCSAAEHKTLKGKLCEEIAHREMVESQLSLERGRSGRLREDLSSACEKMDKLEDDQIKTQILHNEAAALARAEIERLNQLLSELSNQPEIDVPLISWCIPPIDPDTLQMYEKAYGQWSRFKPYLKRIKGHVNQVLAAYNKDVDQYNEAVKMGIKPRKWAGQKTPVTRIHLFK